MRRLMPNNTFVTPKLGSTLTVAIGDMPSREDHLTGEPMSGGYGRTFNAVCKKAGVDASELTILNVIQCRGPHDFFPTTKPARCYISEEDGYKAVQHCVNAHLKPLLTTRPWQKVIVLGDQATQWVTEKWASADKWRGSVLPVPMIDSTEPKAIVTFSPQQLIKQQKFFPVVVNDLQKPIRWEDEQYSLFPSLSEVKAFDATEFAFDIETSYEGNENGQREIYMVALSAERGRALVVPFTGPYINELRRIFADAAEVVGHNIIQFDLPQLAFHGIGVGPDCVVWDTILMQHLRFPDLPHDLEFVASQFLTKPAWKHDKGTPQLYAARDVDANYQIFGPLLNELESAGLLDIYRFVQVPLAKICRKITETGIKIDPARIATVQSRMEQEIHDLEPRLPKELQSYTISKRKRKLAPDGYRDDKGKPKKFIFEEVEEIVKPYRKEQVKKDLLYNQWGLPEQLSPKTGKVTTDKAALDKLFRRVNSPASEFYNPERAAQLAVLKEISRKEHFLSSFADIEQTTERMFPRLNVFGTSSGRLSSSGEAGNFQNQPPAARFMYVPDHEDWEMAEVDYSNIENRLTALLAKDPRLAKYDDPKHSDYKVLASRAFNIPYDEVIKDNDREAPYGKAKMAVLGMNYGLGAVKLASLYDLDLQEVKDLMVTWKKEIWPTIEWQKKTVEQARKQGWLATPFDRKRWFYDSDMATKALSFIPQSTAADCIYRAMLGLMYERIGWPESNVKKVVGVYLPLPQPAKMLLQVHDSLLFTYPKSMRYEVLHSIRTVMEQPFKELGGYKIPVAIAVGPSWGEVEPL